MIPLKACAYHEAGYAVVARHFAYAVRAITISAKGGSCQCDAEGVDAVVFAFAGYASQRKYDPTVSRTCHRLRDAYELAKQHQISDAKVGQLIRLANTCVERLWPKIETLAKQLLEAHSQVSNVPPLRSTLDR